MLGVALSPCKPDWESSGLGFFFWGSVVLAVSVFYPWWFNVKRLLLQGLRSGTQTMHHWRWKSGSYFPFCFTKVSHQLLVPFLLPAQNSYTSPLMSSASHICALLSLPPFLIGAPCLMKSSLHEAGQLAFQNRGKHCVGFLHIQWNGQDFSLSVFRNAHPSSCTYVFSEVLSGLPAYNLGISSSQMFWSDIRWSSTCTLW